MIWIVLLMVLFGAGVSDAATCTAGSTCYCDKVKNVADPIYDPNLLSCEDFDNPRLRQNTGFGGGSPFYGPMYDDTGQTGNRGVNSYWARKYGNGVDSTLWTSGQPSSPSLGVACGFALCAGTKFWTVDDIWQANSYNPDAAIFASAGDFTSEVGTLSAPTYNAGGITGVFSGNASFGYRISAGNTVGIMGQSDWGSIKTRIGVTYAIGYSTNIIPYGGTRSILAQALKHEEWYDTDNPFNWEFSMIGGQQDGLASSNGDAFPFTTFMFAGAGGSSACTTALAGATVNKGTASCDGSGNLLLRANVSEYKWSRDFPLGTWGCIQHDFTWSGGNFSRKSWFNGTLVIDISGFATTALKNQGYKGYKWNDYANINQDANAALHTDTTQFRYVDNFHVTNGAPVSCSQIGFNIGVTNKQQWRGGSRMTGTWRLQ